MPNSLLSNIFGIHYNETHARAYAAGASRLTRHRTDVTEDRSSGAKKIKRHFWSASKPTPTTWMLNTKPYLYWVFTRSILYDYYSTTTNHPLCHYYSTSLPLLILHSTTTIPSLYLYYSTTPSLLLRLMSTGVVGMASRCAVRGTGVSADTAAQQFSGPAAAEQPYGLGGIRAAAVVAALPGTAPARSCTCSSVSRDFFTMYVIRD
jgi:hypothetical protein